MIVSPGRRGPCWPGTEAQSLRWKAYNSFRRHQFCRSHLRRDFQAMIDRQNGGTPVIKPLAPPPTRRFP
jgi:hypothetical protein